MNLTQTEITEAREFFEQSSRLAAASGYELGTATWFVREGQPSIHREQIYGYEPTYNGLD